jgi:hypothetical protein
MIAPIASVLDRAGNSLGDFLPQLAGAFVLVVVGLLVARLVGRLVRRGLLAVGLDEFATRWRITDTLVQARLQPSLAGIIGAAVRITLSVITAFAALTLLGLQPLSQSLNEAVLFLPNLLAALALLLAGVVLAGLARDRVDRFTYQMDFAFRSGSWPRSRRSRSSRSWPPPRSGSPRTSCSPSSPSSWQPPRAHSPSPSGWADERWRGP